MFTKDPNDIAATLYEMDRVARIKCNSNQSESKEVLKEFISDWRRLDQYDRDALASRVMQCRSNGAQLDLDDPRLRGRPARPLDNSKW